MPWKRKVAGGLLAVLGFMLLPLSWCNEAFVNLPLALGVCVAGQFRLREILE